MRATSISKCMGLQVRSLLEEAGLLRVRSLLEEAAWEAAAAGVGRGRGLPWCEGP